MKPTLDSVARSTVALTMLATFTTSMPVAAQAPAGCVPSFSISGRPCEGGALDVRLGADPGCLTGAFLSPSSGPINLFGTELAIGAPLIPLLTGTIPANGAPLTVRLPIPSVSAPLRFFYASVAFDPALPTLTPVAGPSGEFTLCTAAPSIGGVVLLDSTALDNGHSEVQRIASRYLVAPDFLINDDRPTTVGNPWLRWSEMFAGDEVVLPGGEVGNEGWFSLPSTTPWSVGDLVAGVVPQNRLDQIPNMTALRNEQLRALVGRTLVAIVHDSDISMNVQPLRTNLQGDRLGLFAFTVVEVRQPGTIPETGSSSNLYDVVVRVEPPLAFEDTQRFGTQNFSADSIQIERSSWNNGIVTVVGKSAAAHATAMSVTIDGFTFHAPMTPGPASDEFTFRAYSPVDLTGRRVTISTTFGGSYNDRIQ